MRPFSFFPPAAVLTSFPHRRRCRPCGPVWLFPGRGGPCARPPAHPPTLARRGGRVPFGVLHDPKTRKGVRKSSRIKDRGRARPRSRPLPPAVRAVPGFLVPGTKSPLGDKTGDVGPPMPTAVRISTGDCTGDCRKMGSHDPPGCPRPIPGRQGAGNWV